MKKITKFWKCNDCGMVLEDVSGCGENCSGCVPHCCGKPMEAVPMAMKDGDSEKHVPVMDMLSAGVKVSIGSKPHPMTKEHYIAWIEILTPEGRVCRQYLKPGEAPEAFFCSKPAKGSHMRAYCNLHGLWCAEIPE